MGPLLSFFSIASLFGVSFIGGSTVLYTCVVLVINRVYSLLGGHSQSVRQLGEHVECLCDESGLHVVMGPPTSLEA